MKHVLFPILLGLCSIVDTKGQDAAAVDSLHRVLKGPAHDTVKVEANIQLAQQYYLHDPDKAIRYCQQALSISERCGFTEGLTNALGWLAYLHEQQGDIAMALKHNKRALELARRSGNRKHEGTLLNNIAAIYKDRGDLNEALLLNNQSRAIRVETGDSTGLATVTNNIGLIYQGQGKIQEALQQYMIALRLFELLGDAGGTATALQNIGTLYKEQQEFDEALKYFRRSFQIMQRANDHYGVGYALNSLGGVFEVKHELDSALTYYEKALEQRKRINDTQGMAYSLRNIGNIQEKRGNHRAAKEAYGQSLQTFEEVQDKWGEAKVTNLFGHLLMTEKDLVTAETYLKRSLRLAQELGYPLDIRNAADNLQKLYRIKGDWKNALLMNDIFTSMRDSVENIDNRMAAVRTQFGYEYEKKEAVLRLEQEKMEVLAKAQLKRQKLVRDGFIFGFTVVLLFAGVFFAQRNRISKEKQRSEELLLNILPEETAQELKEKGYAEAKQFDEVTVLFTDFKSFTAIAEKLSPEALVKDLHDYFSEFDRIVEMQGLEKIKTIGDAYMAAGGLPVPNSAHATDVVNAALAMARFVESGKAKKIEQGLPFFEIRVGVHTGPVVAGIVGIKKFQYDIWGDTVNIASRMESSGEVGKVNISESTYELVKDQFACEYRGEVEAKGKGKLKMYFVEADR